MNELSPQGVPTWLPPEFGLREIDPVAVTLALRALRSRGGLRRATPPPSTAPRRCSLPDLLRRFRCAFESPQGRSS